MKPGCERDAKSRKGCGVMDADLVEVDLAGEGVLRAENRGTFALAGEERGLYDLTAGRLERSEAWSKLSTRSPKIRLGLMGIRLGRADLEMKRVREAGGAFSDVEVEARASDSRAMAGVR